jgi:S-adenosylmethionine synthetase
MAARTRQYVFRSESVTEGRPDKVPDQISPGITPERIQALVADSFDLRPAALRQRLDRHRPIYQQTAADGHFEVAT